LRWGPTSGARSSHIRKCLLRALTSSVASPTRCWATSPPPAHQVHSRENHFLLAVPPPLVVRSLTLSATQVLLAATQTSRLSLQDPRRSARQTYTSIFITKHAKWKPSPNSDSTQRPKWPPVPHVPPCKSTVLTIFTKLMMSPYLFSLNLGIWSSTNRYLGGGHPSPDRQLYYTPGP
jgi:hypothetical protein